MIEPWQRNRLYGLWAKISASCPYEGEERAARLAYTENKIGRSINSWNELRRAEAAILIAAMKGDLGDRPDTRAAFIASALARELYGAEWDQALSERLERRPYFHYGRLEDLGPRKLRGLIEELLDYLARKQLSDVAPASGRQAAGTAALQKARKEELRKSFRTPINRG